MPIITAYEESQRNVVHKNELLDWLQGEHNKANADLDTANKAIGGLREEVGSLEADTACKSETILTANKRIAYLGKCNDYYEGNRSTHPSKEQTDE